jgi:hypothetical protein
MPTEIKTPILCQCGHGGFLTCTESRRPFSFEFYSLEGFTGKQLMVTDSGSTPNDLLANLEPACPACGQTGMVSYS